MIKKILKILTIIVPVVFIGQACTFNLGLSPSNGGIYKSEDKGQTWQQANNAITPDGKKASISGVDVNTIKIDPLDTKTILIGTNGGLFISSDSGASWSFVSAAGKENVTEVLFDPRSKCLAYAAQANKIIKTSDCGTSWQIMFYEARSGEGINSIDLDRTNPNIVYAGTSSGDVLRSFDFGISWQVIKRLESSIEKIAINQKNTNIIYVATSSDGIYRTINKGVVWENITQKLNEDKRSTINFRNFALLNSVNGLILATDYGLLKTIDAGKNWQEYNMITPPKEIGINALAVDPTNNNIIYYGSDTALYKTVNGGQNWIAHPLPSANKSAAVIAIDNLNTGVLYLGFKNRVIKSPYINF